MEMRNQSCMKRVCNLNQERMKVVTIVRVCNLNEGCGDCERVRVRVSKLQGRLCVERAWVLFLCETFISV